MGGLSFGQYALLSKTFVTLRPEPETYLDKDTFKTSFVIMKPR